MNNSFYSKASPYSFFRMLVLLGFCFNVEELYAQESEQVSEHFRQHHSIALLLSHSHTSQGSVDGKKKWLAMPSWALDYNYFLSKKWSIGLHNDMILETFKVKENETDAEELERTRPIASVAVVSFKPGKHFSFELGAGGEFAVEHDYFLSRLGLEYSLELPDQWELISNVIWDIKWNAYNSFGIGIGVGKSFGYRKK